MTQPSYDLLNEPWIPVLRADGTPAMLGLRDVLLQAHQLRGLAGETPLTTAALYRLLLAVLYRALGAPTTYSWERLWEQGRFPAEALEEYLTRWQHRFDLFHPERPFLQWPDDHVKPKSVIHLVPHMASGNNATLFDHHHEGQEVRLQPDEAARALLVALAFGLAGGMGMAPKDSTNAPWALGVIFFVEGDSLFETLMFNYLPSHYFGFVEELEDRAFWEAENPLKPKREVPLGVADYLTWPNRLLHLIPSPGFTDWGVKMVGMAPGLALSPSVLDPYKHYFRVENARSKRGWRPLKFEGAKAIWRDSVSLLYLYSKAQRSPRVLHWMNILLEDGTIPRYTLFRLMALGWATGKIDIEPQSSNAKIHFYREEHFPVPAEYLTTPALVQQLNEALVLAEAAGRVLGKALSRLATLVLSPTADDPEGRKPDRKDVSNLVGHWGGQRAYWAALEAPFWALLLALPQDGEKALQTWRETVQREAVAAFNHVADALGETPRVLKAVARADRQLRGALFCVFHPQEEKCQTKSQKSQGRR